MTRNHTAPTMTLDDSLPADHAFVIRFRADTGFARGHVNGRIEHVVSGRGIRFASYDEMLGFIRRVLEEPRLSPRE
jgi:hypothetical protein